MDVGTPPLTVTVTEVDGGVTMAVAGEIDLATADQLLQPALEVLTGRPIQLVIDLAGVSFLDSSGLTALLRINEAAADSGCAFQLRRVREFPRRAIEVGGLAGILRPDAPEPEPLTERVGE